MPPTSTTGPRTAFTPRARRLEADERASVAAASAERRSAGAADGGRSKNEFRSPPSWLVNTQGGRWRLCLATAVASPASALSWPWST